VAPARAVERWHWRRRSLTTDAIAGPRDRKPPMSTAKPTCVVCSGALEPALHGARDPQSGERFDVLRCSACRLGVIDPIPADLGRFYGPAYYGKRHGFTAQYRCWRRMRLLRRHVSGDGRLLDVGCGEGDFLAFAARRGWRACGVERGERLRDATQSGVTVYGSVDELRGLATFDVVTLWHSFEHMTEPTQELDRVLELLDDGGTLILVVPDFGGIQAKTFGRSWFHLDVPRHVYHFSQRALIDLVESRGLVVVGVNHHEIEYDLFGWLQSMLNAVLPTPNLFFDWLTGKPVPQRRGELAAGIVLAVLLFPLAVAATALGIVTRRGATINVVARKPAFVRKLPRTLDLPDEVTVATGCLVP
jgi:SAM-dependent methyltransferase